MNGIVSERNVQAKRHRSATVLLCAVLVVVALFAVGAGIAPAAAGEDAHLAGEDDAVVSNDVDNASAEENAVVINGEDDGALNASIEGAQYADVDMELSVEEGVQAPSGSQVSIDVNIEPVEEEEKQISYFDLKIDYDNTKLTFNDIEGSQVGEVEVTDIGAGYVKFENGYELGDFFIDPQEAPLTMATIEFTVHGDEGEAYVEPDPEETETGWGVGWIGISEHDLWYQGGEIEILAADDLGTIEGTVTNEAGEPMEGVDIEAANVAGDATTNADGEYQMFVPGGAAMLQAAHSDGLVNVTETAVVASGETTEQNLTLREFDRDDADVTITTADHIAGQGETIDIPIYAFDRGWSQAGVSDGVRGQGIQIEYDPDVLEVIDAEGGVEDLNPGQDPNIIEDGLLYIEGESASEYFFDAPPWEEMSPFHAGTIQFQVIGTDGDSSEVNTVYDESAIAHAAPEDGGPYWPGSEELGNPASEVTVAGEADVGTATVEGEVTDQDGDPVAGADVTLVSDDGAGTTETDADGQYELSITGFEDPDHVIEFDGGAAYEEVVEKEITAEDGDTASLDAELEEAEAALHIDVEADDSVAQNERITIPVHVEEGSAGVPDEAEDGALGYNFLFDYDTDVLEFVGAESIVFEATESATDPPIVDPDVDPEVSPEYGELRVLSMDAADSAFPPFTTVEVTFDVIGEEGDQTDLEIVPTTSDGEELSAVSHDPAYGAWPAIWDQGSVTVGDEVVDDDRGTVAGAVTTEDGEPIEGAAVQAGSVSDETDEDGEYEFEISEGSYEMSVSHNEYNPATVDIDVEEDELTEQDVELEELDVWIEVDAQDADGGQGAIVSVPIEVEELSDDWEDIADFILGYELFFDYDTDVLEFAGAEDTDSFSVMNEATNIGESDPGYGLGELRVNSSDPTETDTPPLTAVEVTFELVGEPGDTTDLEIIAENEDGEDVSGLAHDQSFGPWPAIYDGAEIEVTDEDVAFGDLEVVVTDGDGDPIEGAAVSGAGIDDSTDSDGEVSVEVQTGSHELTVEAEGESETVSVEIAEDETEAVSVELPIGEDETDDEDDSDDTVESGLQIEAVSTGGFVAFNQETEADAEEEGSEFPDEVVSITGAIDEDDGTWESTSVDFDPFTAQGLDAEATAPDGLEGNFDPESEEMTLEGELVVTLQDEIDLSFELAATVGSSGELEGGVDFDSDGGTATVVDNEFTVPETGTNLDTALGLPADEAGVNWFEFPLEFSVEEVEVDDGGDDDDAANGLGTLQGVVLNEDGDPVDGAIVSFEDEFQETVTDGSGEFEFTHAAGTYELVIEADGYESESVGVDVIDGETWTGSTVLAGGEPVIETDVSATQVDDETVEVSGTVENTGAGVASTDVTLSYGEQSTSESVQVSGGDSETVSHEFDVDGDATGETVELSAGEDSATTTVSASGQEDDDAEDVDAPEDEGGEATVLNATGQGGFIAFNETDEATAKEDGLAFPSQAENDSWISFVAVVDEDAGTWTSTDTNFPQLNVNENLAASVEAPEGLSGEIDPEADHMTLEGELEVTVLDRTQDDEPLEGAEPFAFEIDMVVGDSGELEGSASFDGNDGAVALVDNEYVINDQTGDVLVDGNVGLPSTDAGTNFLELEFDIEIEEGADPDEATAGGGADPDDDGDDSDDGDDDNGTFIAAFGQLIGLVGVAAGLLLVIFGLGRKFMTSVDPDPEK